MESQQKSIALINKFFIGLIKAYRLLFSPVIGNSCRFYPTCSHYAEEAFEALPAWRAFLKSAWRILRCNPYGKGGYDPVIKYEEH